MMLFSCMAFSENRQTSIPKRFQLPVGILFQDAASNGTYKVLSGGTNLAYVKALVSRATIKLPATVDVNGRAYNVTPISASAFTGNTVVTKVLIGKTAFLNGRKTENADHLCHQADGGEGGR